MSRKRPAETADPKSGLRNSDLREADAEAVEKFARVFSVPDQHQPAESGNLRFIIHSANLASIRDETKRRGDGLGYDGRPLTTSAEGRTRASHLHKRVGNLPALIPEGKASNDFLKEIFVKMPKDERQSGGRRIFAFGGNDVVQIQFGSAAFTFLRSEEGEAEYPQMHRLIDVLNYATDGAPLGSLLIRLINNGHQSTASVYWHYDGASADDVSLAGASRKRRKLERDFPHFGDQWQVGSRLIWTIGGENVTEVYDVRGGYVRRQGVAGPNCGTALDVEIRGARSDGFESCFLHAGARTDMEGKSMPNRVQIVLDVNFLDVTVFGIRLLERQLALGVAQTVRAPVARVQVSGARRGQKAAWQVA